MLRGTECTTDIEVAVELGFKMQLHLRASFFSGYMNQLGALDKHHHAWHL